MTPQQYIFDRAIGIPDTGCWLWTECILSSGYGVSNSPDRIKTNELAHRASYRIFKGSIPKGMVVAHSCDMPSCVNPNHLWLGTHKQNSEDMVQKNRSAKWERCGKSKLTKEQVDFIRESKLSHRKLGAMFDVSHSNIGYIRRNKTWT